LEVDAEHALHDGRDEDRKLGHVVGGEEAKEVGLDVHGVLVFGGGRDLVSAGEELDLVRLELVAVLQLVEEGKAGAQEVAALGIEVGDVLVHDDAVVHRPEEIVAENILPEATSGARP